MTRRKFNVLAKDGIINSSTTFHRYRQAKERYRALENLSAEDNVLFVKARQMEEFRRKVFYNRLRNSEKPLGDDDDALFVEQDGIPEWPFSSKQETHVAESNKTAPKKVPKKGTMKPSNKDKMKSMELGLRRMVGTNQLTTKLYGIAPSLDQNKEKIGHQKSRKKTTRLSEKDLESLWKPTDIISSSKANAALPEIPTFKAMDKSKALTELIASIPALSPDDQAAAKSDRQRILEATRKFDHKPSSDGKGLWKVKGLKTSLLHHQVRGEK